MKLITHEGILSAVNKIINKTIIIIIMICGKHGDWYK